MCVSAIRAMLIKINIKIAIITITITTTHIYFYRARWPRFFVVHPLHLSRIEFCDCWLRFSTSIVWYCVVRFLRIPSILCTIERMCCAVCFLRWGSHFIVVVVVIVVVDVDLTVPLKSDRQNCCVECTNKWSKWKTVWSMRTPRALWDRPGEIKEKD